ncbi:MAG: hypothetical protein U0166_18615 [Acidobacteriota bacterium]
MLFLRVTPRPGRRRFSPTSLWVVVAFGAWLRRPLPNTYYAKVWPGLERWRAGLAYAMDFAVGSGPVFSSAPRLRVRRAARRRGYPAALAGSSRRADLLRDRRWAGLADGRFFHRRPPS